MNAGTGLLWSTLWQAVQPDVMDANQNFLDKVDLILYGFSVASGISTYEFKPDLYNLRCYMPPSEPAGNRPPRHYFMTGIRETPNR
jgi:hypothetical protein